MIGRHKRSYPEGLRKRARELRRSGLTYAEICAALGVDIPKSTLSHWVSDILLGPEQQQRIAAKATAGAARGRAGGKWGGAAGYNKEMKRRRLDEIAGQVRAAAHRLARDREALLLMAAALYMGEGVKRPDAFAFANSDPRLVQVWLAILRRHFAIDEAKFRCQLAISRDMDEDALRQFWSRVTGIPLAQFMRSSIKTKPASRPRDGYRGVCSIYYYSTDVRRVLAALGEQVIDELLSQGVQ